MTVPTNTPGTGMVERDGKCPECDEDEFYGGECMYCSYGKECWDCGKRRESRDHVCDAALSEHKGADTNKMGDMA